MRYAHKAISRIFSLIMIAVLALQYIPSAKAAGRDKELNAKIQQIIGEMPSSYQTDAEKALYLHDYIVKNVEYKMQGDHQTAYGALLDGVAVCAGYTDAYKQLLAAVGIESMTITGQSYNPQGELENHAWTMVIIDGKCLFTDVTWDDPFIDGAQDDNYISHEYFNISLEQMNKDHYPDAESKKYLPSKCGHTGYDFYSIYQGDGTGYGIFDKDTTSEQAAKYFKYLGVIDGYDTFVCEYHYKSDNIDSWISSNWIDIATNLNLSGRMGVSCQMGRSTVTMIITGTLDKTVSVTGVSLNQTKITLTAAGESIQLKASVTPGNATNKAVTFQSSDPGVASVSVNGMVTAVSNGTAIITVTTIDGRKTATCAVTVSIPEPPAPPVTETTEPPTQPTQAPTEPPAPSQPDNSEPTHTDPAPTTGATVEPTQPSGVLDPTYPTDATDPTEPTDPIEPTEPSDVTDPIENTDSSEPSNPTDPTQTEEETGNTSQLPSQDSSSPTSATQSAEEKTEKSTRMPWIFCIIFGSTVLPVILILLRKSKC